MKNIITAITLMLVFFITPPLHAANEKSAIEYTGKTYLAYIITGNRTTDATSQAGLTSLANTLQRRTSLETVAVTGIDPSSEDLAFFPLLYWPLGNTDSPLSPSVATNINAYLRHGGMILFDTGPDAEFSGAAIPPALRGINLPPLERLPANHVLKRSFYILDDVPGRFNSNATWIESGQNSANDGVASVIVGGNSWAESWAVDGNGQPQFACVPGGEQQREQAFRFGVNLVMYALTGNYKSDQIHARALLERTGE